MTPLRLSGAPCPFGSSGWNERERPTNPVPRSGRTPTNSASHVGTEGRRVTEVQDIALIEGVTGGESVTETYELHHDTPELVAGTYRFSVCLSARAGEVTDSISLDFKLTVAENQCSEPDTAD